MSYLTAITGGLMIAFANSDYCFYEYDCPHSLDRHDRAIMATGGILVAAGVAGFVVSIVRIRQKKEKKRKLEWEMARLRFGSS